MKNLLKTKFLGLLLGIVSISLLTGCLKDNDNDTFPQSVLTMVNGYVGSNSVFYVADNNNIQYPNNPLQYQMFSFVNLFPGSRNIKIYTNNDNQSLISEGAHTFKDSTYYTSFIYGWEEDTRHFISEDTLLTNLGTNSALRFLHLSPSAGNVKLFLDNKETLLFDNRTQEDPKEESIKDHIVFKTQNSGKHTLILTDENNETLVEREETFVAGRHYSIILIGDNESRLRPLYIGIVKQY